MDGDSFTDIKKEVENITIFLITLLIIQQFIKTLWQI